MEPISDTWPVRNLSAAVNVSNGETGIQAILVTNITGTDAFVQVFNLAAGSVTLGTTVPLMSLYAKANDTRVIGFDRALRFDRRMAVAATTTVEGSTTHSGIYLQAFVT